MQLHLLPVINKLKKRKNNIKLCLKLHKQYIADIDMVTGVVTTNMNPNVLGAVPTQLKETPLKSDRRVSVKKTEKKD